MIRSRGKNNQCLHSFHLPTYTIQNLNCSLECNAVIQQDLVTHNLATASNAVNVLNSSWVLNMSANVFKEVAVSLLAMEGTWSQNQLCR